MLENKKKLTLVIVLALVVLLGTIIGVVIWQNGKSDRQPAAASEPTDATKLQEPGNIKFPYTIPGTQLVIQSVKSYDGIFLEDGSDRHVTGVSTIVLVNQGSQGIPYAEIKLQQGETELHYQATSIPAGATVVVQESNITQYTSAEYSACSANVAAATGFEMSENMVKVEEIENGTLLVTNLTEEKIPCVQVFYKFALEKGDIYVGGITYMAEITNLQPGKSKKLTASHFAPDSSEVIMVQTIE